MYAFVDMEQYQIVGTGNSPALAKDDFLKKLQSANINVNANKPEEKPAETTEVKGTVASVQTAVVGGNTKYYVMLRDNDNVYTLDISLSEKLPFMKSGDSVAITLETRNEKTTVKSVKIG